MQKIFVADSCVAKASDIGVKDSDETRGCGIAVINAVHDVNVPCLENHLSYHAINLRPQTFLVSGNTVSAFGLSAKTNAGQEAYCQQNDPHPDPLPSDGVCI